MPQTETSVGKHGTSVAPESQAGVGLSDCLLTIGAIEQLAVRTETQYGQEVYYEAAYPGYQASFTRDALTAMSLWGNAERLLSQLDYSIKRLGVKCNPVTGEEPGKAHHELPEAINELGLSSAYNATDATAEVLRSIAILASTGYPEVLQIYGQAIDACTAYVKRHIDERGLFIEDPKFAGNTEPDARKRSFMLKVTSWKDSELNRESRRTPHYPIVYSTVHFQYASALQRLARVKGDPDMYEMGRQMTQAGLAHLWQDNHFVAAIDGAGAIDPPSSDSLMCLLYINPDQLPDGRQAMIEDYMNQLETPAGYRAGIPTFAAVDPYHMNVWTHEQALLHAAALKHGLINAAEVTRRITGFIKPQEGLFPELVVPDTLQPGGNEKQLWAMAAYLYFDWPDSNLL